jgi:DNA-directed RNA polymerase subunit RPC12/RpoP
MEEWYCFKCNQKMEGKDLVAVYMEIVRFTPGLQCPGCGAAYLMEKTVVEVVSKGEEEIEAKL